MFRMRAISLIVTKWWAIGLMLPAANVLKQCVLVKQLSRCFIQVAGTGGVGLQDAGRIQVAYASLQCVADCCSLTAIRHRANDLSRCQDLPDGHRYGPPRYRFECVKPSFGQLLTSAILIQPDDDKRLVGFEIGRRVVETQMAVLADADQRHIDRLPAYHFPEPLTFGSGI